MAKAIAHTYGIILIINDCAGGILETLETLRCADATPIVFTLDHGEPLAEHRLRRECAQSLHVRLITAAQGMISGQRQQMVRNLNLRFYLNSRKGKTLGLAGSSLAPDTGGDAIAVC